MTNLQDSPGIPSQLWWTLTRDTFYQMCQMLTHDINTEGHNRAGQPRITILPSGTFGSGLSLKGDELDCIAFGSVRKDLFIEVAWQNIFSEKYRDMKTKVYEASEQGLLLGISGFYFRVPYIECPELLRTHPDVIDAPEEFRSTLRAEIEVAVDNLQELELWNHNIRKVPLLRQLYYFMRTWASSCGLYAENNISCFDASTLQEFTYRTIFNNKQVDYRSMNPFALVCQFLAQHEACNSPTGQECPFSINGTNSRFSGTKKWSGEQFRIVHEELRCLHARHLAVSQGQQTDNNWFYDVWEELRGQPISRTMKFRYNVRITMQYSGQSQLEGTEMMGFVEEMVLKLEGLLERLQKKVNFRIWPTRLVEAKTSIDDNPYEGLWLIGISIDDRDQEYSAVQSSLREWNSQVHADCRYSPSIMFVHAELVSRELTLQKELKDDPRKWPRPIMQSDQNMGIDLPTKSPTNVGQPPIAESKVFRKLRPAMEVLSRLKHDPSFELDDFVVGYTDRHSGIEEREARNWVTESTDDEWIPQSRIQYFRRISSGEIVWDRASKIDAIFKT